MQLGQRSDTYNVPVLDEDFPEEVAFWEANKEELSKGNQGRYLVIRGTKVCKILHSSDELRLAEEEDLAKNPALVRYIFEPDPVLSPFSQERVSA